MATRSIPRPGLGTWQLRDPEVCANAIEHALQIGYEHVDTAESYENERAVGRGIDRSERRIDDLYIATKLHHRHLAAGDVARATRDCLERLDLDSVDLLYVHWPTGSYEASETLPAMAETVDEGLVDALGVSNFSVALLDEAMDIAGDVIVAHQYEKHPFLPNERIHRRTADHGLTTVAYSPLARGRVVDDETITAIAKAHDATPAQVALAWLMRDDDVVPIPKSGIEAHIEENLAATALDLDEEALARIDAIDERVRVVDPSGAPWNR